MKTITLKTVKIAAILIIFIAGTTSIFAQSKEANPEQEVQNNLYDDVGIGDSFASADNLEILSVYNNESNIVVNLQNNSKENFSVEIFDLAGRTIVSEVFSGEEKHVNREYPVRTNKKDILIVRLRNADFLLVRKYLM